MDDIKGKVSRAKVAEARKKARTKRRLGQEGVSAQNVIRESRRVGEIMREKKKTKVKKMTWKYKRGDVLKAKRDFFKDTELTLKRRTGKVSQTNSKFQGSIPAYNIKWDDQEKGIWYDKESVESELSK